MEDKKSWEINGRFYTKWNCYKIAGVEGFLHSVVELGDKFLVSLRVVGEVMIVEVWKKEGPGD